MVTKQQALAAGYRTEFHHGECRRIVGPRGGITLRITNVRVSGACQTWKTRPTEFRLPVKYGLYESSAITHSNASEWHLAAECPLDAHEQPTVEDYGATAADGAACRAMTNALRAAHNGS